MLSLLLVTIVTLNPDETFRLALGDLKTNVPIQERYYTRYLSISGIPEDIKKNFVKANKFVINSDSFRSSIVPIIVVNNDIIRLNLFALGWDRQSRQEDINNLLKEGVDLRLRDPNANYYYVDIWEDMQRFDPFFNKEWIDPASYQEAKKLSYSEKFIMAAWDLYPKLMLERQKGGFYSQLLLLPPNEKDLYKRFGVPIEFIEGNRLHHGAAVTDTKIVALHNRELQEIPSTFGLERFIWRTFDFKDDADIKEKNVLRTFVGTVKHDGREIIGSLPNGLHWYYLADGQGTQVAVVPQDIAIDMRQGNKDLVIVDRNVVNWYKCIDCHGSFGGIYPFTDEVGPLLLERDKLRGLGLFSYYKDKIITFQRQIEEYYLPPVSEKILRQQKSYEAKVFETTALSSSENSRLVVSMFNKYFWDSIGQEQAAIEMGYSLEKAKQYWYASHDDNLIVLASGKKIRRAAWQTSVKNAFPRPVLIIK